jgi:exonuclease VII large subunit
MEGVVDLMGEQEDKEIKQAVDQALVTKRIGDLEHWKDLYEKSQQEKFERMQEENTKERIKFEEKLDHFMDGLTKQITELTTQLNNQKTSWMSKAPWSLVALITGLFGFSASLVTYLLTK